ncbi:centromere protein C isoform X2 [Setaria italica]|uniref:centromere protein C isoform X2 n=1 Tax=Setaria italica TaxID=4555 RepID=UPI000BE55809|nr:centromere protein C isoform X2 [Setaria italica]
MDAADPLRAISSPARLLPRTLGPAATAASPSKAREVLLEAISRARLLKGSKELVEQARMVLKGHGDIRMLYHDDGVKVAPHANGTKDQQGRRPGPDRKRSRFTQKAHERKLVPAVDHSNVLKIKDPNEYYKKLDDIEEAEKEIRRLNGEVVDEMVMNFDPVVEPKRRSTLLGRKSVRTFKFADADTQDPTEVPASQTETMTGSQLSQDDAHASFAEKNEQSVPPRSGQCAISDVSEKEDSLAEKDGDDLTYVLASLKNLDGSEEEDFLRKILKMRKIEKENVCLHNSVPEDRPRRSNTARKKSMRVPPENPLPQSCQSRVSELEKHLFPGVAGNDKCADLQEDDESEGSPDIVMGEQSLVHDSSDVLVTDETFAASEIDKETPNLGVKAADHVIDPEPNMPDRAGERQAGGSPLGLYTASEYDRETPNLGVKAAEHVLDPEPIMPDHADERQAEGSPLGLYSNTEVAKEKAACSRSDISMEDNVPIDNPTDMSNNETEVSSPHHLEGSLAEVLARTPVRNVASDGVDQTSHAAEDNIQHLEAVEEDGVIQDKSSHPSEVPLEDIDPVNQPQMHDGNNKKLAADLSNAVSPIKEKKRQAARKGKKKQQSKRSQKVAGEIAYIQLNLIITCDNNRPTQALFFFCFLDESNHPLEISQANFDSENQSRMDENIEQQRVVTSSALSPNKAKGQKGAQMRNRTKHLNQRKSLGDAGLAWQSGVRRSTRIRSRPLEHWRGERFVYGRIHDTMATVIGIKAYSPGQDGKKTLKVKSFVPEQYSDLVAESAKY